MQDINREHCERKWVYKELFVLSAQFSVKPKTALKY